jgi:hypothetical protein
LQVADVANLDAAAFDLDDDALGLVGLVVEEEDLAVDAAVGALLALLGVGGPTERAGGNERACPPLELETVFACQFARRFVVDRLADDVVVFLGQQTEGVAQTVLEKCSRDVGDVDAQSFAPQLVGSDDGSAAAGKGIENDVARIAAGVDDALEQGKRFLGGVAKAFGGKHIERIDVRPYFLNRDSLSLVKIHLDVRPCARFIWPVNEPLCIK